MIKKYFLLTTIFLSIVTIGSIWLFSSATSALGIAFLLFSFAVAITTIFEKHKQAENPRPKITKDVLVLVISFLLILFFGGLVGMFANTYVNPRFGGIAGFVAAIAASFVIGYFVKKGMGMLSG